ncbi:MAG: type II toxin-antitoxin system VapC family toxin [Bryobacterales bacterium]
MRLLLDTHTLLWAAADDKRVPPRVYALLRGQENKLFLSAASGWEIVIKHGTGRLHLPDTPGRFLRRCLDLFALEPISVTFEHTLRVETLPAHHRDPFDRILIAQAHSEDLTILTNDKAFANYPIATTW